MTAYLRSDLWSKSYVYQAERQIEDAGFSKRLNARYNFACAAVCAVGSSAIYLIAMLILFAPHVACRLFNRCADGVLLHRVSHLFYRSMGRFQASLVITFVALISLFHLRFSTIARDVLNRRLEQQWTDDKNNLCRRFQARMEQVQRVRLKAVAQDEICRPDGRNALYALKTRAIAQGIIAYCQARGLGADVNSRYEYYEEAMEDIDLFVSRQQRELWTLPVTYLDVGNWSVQQAYRYRTEALGFLDRQAESEAVDQQQQNPRFDRATYAAAVAAYRRQMAAQLDAQIVQVQEQQRLIAQQWVNVANWRPQIALVEKQLRSAQWWLNLTPILPEEWGNALREQAAQVERQLNHAKSQRLAWVRHIADGLFLTLQKRFIALQKTHNHLVGQNGAILKQVAYLGHPPWYARAWRYIQRN